MDPRRRTSASLQQFVTADSGSPLEQPLMYKKPVVTATGARRVNQQTDISDPARVKRSHDSGHQTTQGGGLLRSPIAAADQHIDAVIIDLCNTALILATGAGAVSRFNMSLVIASGLAIGTLFTLFVVPAAYMLIAANHRHHVDATVERVVEARS